MSREAPPAGPRSLGPAILRIAGWPIDTIAPLRSGPLAERVDAWIATDDALRGEGATLAGVLHDLIPRIEDRATRRAALAIKRHLHATTAPLPEGPAAAFTDGLRRPSGGAAHEQTAALLAAARLRRCAHAAERAAIGPAHAADLDRAAAELARVTGEDRFLRALCVASPSAYRQARRNLAGETGARSHRRFRDTLHRYLMRAVGRATPNGLWAGISLEDMAGRAGQPLALAPAPCVTRVSPALAIFARILEHRARHRPWSETLAWRINPTLRRSGDGWTFGTLADGGWCMRQLAHHAAIEGLTAWFTAADRPGLADIAAALQAQCPGLAQEDAQRFVDECIAAGLFSSDIGLPTLFRNTWEALDAIIAALPPGERPSWQECRETLAGIAGAIEAGIDGLDPDALRDRLDSARDAVHALSARYGASVSGERGVLVVDRTAPFRFSLSAAFAGTIDRRLRDYWAFDRYGLGEIESRIGAHRMFGDLAEGVPIAAIDRPRGGGCDPAPADLQDIVTWEDRVLRTAPNPLARQARDAFERWEREVGPFHADAVHRLRGAASTEEAALPPGSALLLVGALAGGHGPVLRIGGVTPEPCFFYARFSALLCADARAPDAFLAWQRRSTDAIAHQWPRVRFLDLAIRNPGNPNVAARPRLATHRVDPLADADETLAGAMLSCGRDGRPILSEAGTGRRLIPAARSAVHLDGLDGPASILSAIALHLGRPALLGPMPRLSREIAEWRHLPRLVLGSDATDQGDTVVGPERWTPGDDLGASLVAAQGAERFIRWRRFVRAARLPAFVYAFHGSDQTECLLATDSAIGVECLARDLRADRPSIRFQEMYPAPHDLAVRDADGRGYVAELAVAWSGNALFWDRYAASGSSDAEPCG